MKIRTDFVTNSSSSSFVVEIDVYGKDNSFPVYKIFKPSVDGNGEPNLNCTAEELLNADSVESLLDILRGAIKDEHFGYFDDQYKKEMQSFTDLVAKSFPDLSDISRIKLERRWSAWGETASSMIWNNEELKELCKAVCNSSNKEEKQAAIEALKDYLDYEPAHAYGEAVDWPTGFLGSKVNGSFVWDSTPEQLARYVCADMISPNDEAEEITVIDMDNRTIEQSARYELQRTGELPSDEHEFRMEGSELTKYSGPGGDVIIPDGVTEIKSYAFKGCSSLESITIPNGVTSIQQGAFEECSSLESITIPEGVMSIGSSVFEGCSNLKSVTIPDSVRNIGWRAFKGCSSLESVSIQDSVVVNRFAPFDAFRECKKLADENGLVIVRNTLFDYFGTGGSVVIPDNVNRIGGDALFGKSITQITFLCKPDSIEVDGFGRLSGIKAVFPQGALRTSKTLSAEWLNLSFDTDETDLAYLIMYQKSKGWLDYVCSNSGDPALVIEHLIELMSTKKKVSKAVSENVAIYLRRHYASVPRERISWLMEYLSDNKGKELDALRNDPGFKRYLDGENAPEPVAAATPPASGRCAGMTFVITGSVTRFKNRAAFTEYVKSQGGKVSGSVSDRTSFLVNNDAASSSTKNRTANSLGVPIISEEEFVKRFGKP